MEQKLMLFFPPENCYFAGIKLTLWKFSGCSQELPAFALATACVGNRETEQGASLLNNSAALGCSCCWKRLAGVSSLGSCDVWAEGTLQTPEGTARPYLRGGQDKALVSLPVSWAGWEGSLDAVEWAGKQHTLGPLVISICCCWNSGCHTQSFRPDAWFHYSSIQTCPVSQETLPPVPVSPGTAALWDEQGLARTWLEGHCWSKTVSQEGFCVSVHNCCSWQSRAQTSLCKISQDKSLYCLCTLALSGSRHTCRQLCAHTALWKGVNCKGKGALVYQQEFGLLKCVMEEKLWGPQMGHQIPWICVCQVSEQKHSWKLCFSFNPALLTLTQTQTHRCPHTLGCSQQKGDILKFPNLTHP